MRPYNPFLIQGYYTPEYFCDREAERATMVDALHNGRNLTLIAPRRMGKTGLIRHVFHQLKSEHPEIVTLYMDIYSTQNLGDFVRLFAATVLGQLDSIPQKALKRVSQFIKSCRPVFTFDEVTGLPKVSIDVEPTGEQATLKEIFDYLASSDKRCYIAIDEFQQIAEYPEQGVEALLRSYIQFVPNLHFIYAGSKQHVMQEMFLSAKSPFYQSTQLLAIGTIDKEAYFHFAQHFFEEQGWELPYEVFDYIYSRFDGHTWYIQALLNRLYGYRQSVDLSMVEYAITEIVNESVYSYENILATQPKGSIKLLRAIAKEGVVKEVMAGDFIARHKLKAASTIASTIKRLVNIELIYNTPKGYILYDRFMNEWLRGQEF